MRSTAIEHAPTTAPVVATGGRGRSDDAFANVLARCTDVDAEARPQTHTSDDRTTPPAADDVDATPPSTSTALAQTEVDAAAEDDDVPMIDDADVVAEDDSIAADATTTAHDAGPTIAVAPTELQPTATPVIAPMAIDATIRDTAASTPPATDPVAVDASARTDAAPVTDATSSTPPSRLVRRPTPADGTDARARASIANHDAIVTGVPMRTDGGVRVDLRAPIVAPANGPIGGVAPVSTSPIDVPTESGAAHEPSVRDAIIRETTLRSPATPEAVARETAAIETTPHASPAHEPRVARRTGGERRGPITLARTEATPSPRAIPTPVAPPNDTQRSAAPSSATTSEPSHAAEPSSAATPSEPAPSSDAAAPVVREPNADPIASAPSDAAAIPTTPTDALVPSLATAPAESPTSSRAAPPTPSADAPVVLTRAEDLAQAIEKLKPIPRGGATLEVETPGLGQMRVQVQVEDGVVKVRIHASSDAGATWLAQERDGLTAAARGAVNGALGIELDLRGGTNDASDRRPSREPTPLPSPYAGAPPRSTSSASSSAPTPTARARGLVDVLA